RAFAVGLAAFLRRWTIDGLGGGGGCLLLYRRALGLLPSRQAALRLHGALQKEKRRFGTRGQRARSPAAAVCFQLPVRCLHRAGSTGNGPGPERTAIEREHGGHFLTCRHCNPRRRLAGASGPTRDSWP